MNLVAPQKSRRQERVAVDQRPWLFADEVAVVEGIDQSQVYRNAVAGRYGPVCRTVGGGVRILKTSIPLWQAWEAMQRRYDASAPAEPAATDDKTAKEASNFNAGKRHR